LTDWVLPSEGSEGKLKLTVYTQQLWNETWDSIKYGIQELLPHIIS
jgi:hypothetical protein